MTEGMQRIAADFVQKARLEYPPFPDSAQLPDEESKAGMREFEMHVLEQELSQLADVMVSYDGNKFMFAKQYRVFKEDLGRTVVSMRQDASKPPEIAKFFADLFFHVVSWKLKQMSRWFVIRWGNEEKPSATFQLDIIEKYAESPIRSASGGCLSIFAVLVSLFASAGILVFMCS